MYEYLSLTNQTLAIEHFSYRTLTAKWKKDIILQSFLDNICN